MYNYLEQGADLDTWKPAMDIPKNSIRIDDDGMGFLYNLDCVV